MKKTFFISFFLIITLILTINTISTVKAIGVSPAKITIDYKPGLEGEYQFMVKNNAGYPLDATISFSGDFAEYATAEPETVSLRESKIGYFKVKIKLPEEWDKPGKNILRVNVIESVENSGGINTRTAVVPWIVINVPYPGRYAQITSFKVADGKKGVNEGEDTPVEFSIKNMGKEDLDKVNAKIELIDNQEKVLETQEFNNLEIKQGETYSKSLMLSTKNKEPSDYQAKLTVTYDDKVLERKTNFIVGKFDMKIINYTREIEKEGIKEFFVEIQNRWKGKVFAEAQITLPNGTTARTPREQFNDFQQKKLTGYIDTSKLSEGPNQGTITLYFSENNLGEQEEQKTEAIIINVIKKKEPATESPLNIKINMTTLIIIALVILLIINSFVMYKAFSKK